MKFMEMNLINKGHLKKIVPCPNFSKNFRSGGCLFYLKKGRNPQGLLAELHSVIITLSMSALLQSYR